MATQKQIDKEILECLKNIEVEVNKWSSMMREGKEQDSIDNFYFEKTAFFRAAIDHQIHKVYDWVMESEALEKHNADMKKRWKGGFFK